MWLDERQAGDLGHLVSQLEELSRQSAGTGERWIYRGQSHANWKLEPSIERRSPGLSVRAREGNLLWDFKRHCGSLSDKLPDYCDTPSWLALMRHHGAPTRLLDWTDSWFVAMFFACEDAKRNQKDDDQNSAIWALNASLLNEMIKARATEVIPDAGRWPQLNLSTEPEQFHKAAWYAFDEDTNKEKGLVVELQPRWSNSRMSFQQGTFLMNLNHQLPFEESLTRMVEGVPSVPPWAVKIVFPWNLRDDIWRYLYERNVHSFTLFPDLDGLGFLLKLKDRVYWSKEK